MEEMQNFDKIDELLKTGSYDEAVKMLNEIMSTDPRNEEALFRMANVYHLKGEIGQAIKTFTKVIEVNPNNTEASISLSVLYNDIGKYDQAKTLFEKANEKVKSSAGKSNDPSTHKINKIFSHKHYELAELYMSYNRLDEALFEYNKAAALDTKNLEIRIKVAKVFTKKGYVTKAIQELRKLKNENPTYIPARLALGIVYYGQGKVIEAQNEWSRALSKDPKNSELKSYINMAQTATETSLEPLN